MATTPSSRFSPIIDALRAKEHETPRGRFALERAELGSLTLTLRPDFDSPDEADYEIYLFDSAAKPPKPTVSMLRAQSGALMSANELARKGRDQGLGGIGATQSRVKQHDLAVALAKGPPYLPQLVAPGRYPWLPQAIINQELIDIFPPYEMLSIRLAAPTPKQWAASAGFTLLVSVAGKGAEIHPFEINPQLVLNAIAAGERPAAHALASSPTAVKKACELAGGKLAAVLESIELLDATRKVGAVAEPRLPRTPAKRP